MMASAELAAKLKRRQQLSDVPDIPARANGAGNELAGKLQRRASLSEPVTVFPTSIFEKKYGLNSFNPSSEFKELSKKEIDVILKAFKLYDTDGSGTLSMDELKSMMEKLGYPQSRASLCEMIRDVDQDRDGEFSLQEFFTIFQKYRKGSLESCKGLLDLVKGLDIDDVSSKPDVSFLASKLNSKPKEEKICPQNEPKIVNKLKKTPTQRSFDFQARLNIFDHNNQSNMRRSVSTMSQSGPIVL